MAARGRPVGTVTAVTTAVLLTAASIAEARSISAFSAPLWSPGPTIVVPTPPPPNPTPTVAPPPTPQPRRYAQASALPSIGVRGGDHPDYGRLVFDWTTEVPYRVERDGERVRVRFDRPVRLALAGVAGDPPRNVLTVRQTGERPGMVEVSVTPGSRLRDLRVGTKIVLDVLDPLPGTAVAAAAATPADAEAAPEPVEPGAADIEAADPAPVEVPPATTTTASPEPEPPAAAAALPRPRPKPIGDDRLPAPAAPAGAGPATTAISGPASSEGGAPVPSDVAATEPGSAAPAAETVEAAPAVPDRPGDQPAVAGPPVLEIAPDGPAAAAVFARAGNLIVVFDRPVGLEAVRRRGGDSDLIGEVMPVAAVGGGAVRIEMQPWLKPAVARDGDVWRVAFLPERETVPYQPEIRSEPGFVLGARLLVVADDPGGVVELVDPAVGDRLLVVPLAGVPEAVATPRRYAQLSFLGALQGIVVRPRVDGVRVRTIRDGVEITSADGLKLSPPEDVDAASRAVGIAADGEDAAETARRPLTNTRRLFDLEGWRRGGGIETVTPMRQALQRAVIDSPPDRKLGARLDLARFYFANGMTLESQGILDVIAAAEPDLLGWPAIRALVGAIGVDRGDPAAAALLAEDELRSNREAALWRAVAAADTGDWDAAAAGFAETEALLADYPMPYFRRFSERAIEAALETDRPALAERRLGRLVERGGPATGEAPRVVFLRGRIMAATDRTEEALEAWRTAVASDDRLARARAGLALTALEEAEGLITPAEAADRLARQRYAWRGDALELDALERYGDALWRAASYGDGLVALRAAAGLFPESARATAITQDMARRFADLFADGAAALPPLEALALYDQFRELTPVGAEGDQVIRRLADRLVEVDLLGRAADLLEHQVSYRLAGLEKAEIGARLASIRLLDGQPDQALAGLAASEIANLPETLIDERRLLRARALAGLERSQDALDELAGLSSREAELLRVEIAWRNRDWHRAAAALATVTGPPPEAGEPLAVETADLVINRAVALTLAGDSAGLAGLRDLYGAAMADSPRADAFRVITRPDADADFIDLETVRARVAEVEVFDSFLKGYLDPTRDQRADASLVN